MSGKDDESAAFAGPPRRDFTPRAAKLLAGFSVVIALVHLYFNTLSTMAELRVSALHFALFAAFAALLFPAVQRPKPGMARALLGVDILIALSACACAIYLIFAETALYARGQDFIWSDWLFSILAVVIVLELVRRTTGLFIPILTIIALTYVTVWGRWVDGSFAFAGLSWETLFFRAYFSTDGMFGPIARISWSFVFMFILFGAFLVRSGAGDFIIRLAQAVAGRLTGGPGLVAVFASGLMGSVTGSAIANTVSTGVITIPVMKRAGFKPAFAGGTEAAASTGGQLMPPVMGAGAFIMASITQISYLVIIAAALVPALLYFFSVAIFVRITAKRSGLVPQEGAQEGENILRVLRDGWAFLIPIAVLVAGLVSGFTPTYAAGLAILATIAASWIKPLVRRAKGVNPADGEAASAMTPGAIVEATMAGATTMAVTAMLLIGVGLIVMVINATGIGATFSLMINSWAGGSLFLTIALVALASLILGMGLPVTAAYIVLATLSAPAIAGLIQDAELIRLLMTGEVSETAKAIFMLAAPDKAAMLGEPMSRADASALLSQVPADIRGQLSDSMLSAEAIMGALLAAHMIIFWLSQDSNVTPPVCLAAFAAASIAGAKPMATGVQSWKLAKGLYIVPLLFAYTPILTGSPLEIAAVALAAALGLWAAAGAIEGYLEGPLSLPLRALSGALAAALLAPHGMWMLDLAAGGGFLALLWLTRTTVAPQVKAPVSPRAETS